MTNYQYTDWMAQFSEAERLEYVEIAQKGFQNLTPEEEAFLTRWNNAKAIFDAEILQALTEMQSNAAIARANSIASLTTAINNIQVLEQEAIENYERTIGSGEDELQE